MIQLENVSFSYGKRKPIFQNLNLTLKEGNVYGLLGKNGAGKSSLLRIIAGLLFPINGTCKVDNWLSEDRQPNFLQNIYYFPEEFHTPNLKIKEYLKIYGPFYPNFSKEQFNNYLVEFQLSDNESFTDLSLGQKKKVMIGLALATNTKLLILDEPTNGLDIPSKSQFRKIIASVATDDRIIMISTHQVRDLESLIDPIIILENSEVIMNASIEQLSEKLSFKTVAKIEGNENILYSESSIKGHTIITENIDNEPTRIDLELLFNAVLNNPTVFKQTLNNEIYEKSI